MAEMGPDLLPLRAGPSPISYSRLAVPRDPATPYGVVGLGEAMLVRKRNFRSSAAYSRYLAETERKIRVQLRAINSGTSRVEMHEAGRALVIARGYDRKGHDDE